jgi:hypothetical protein
MPCIEHDAASSFLDEMDPPDGMATYDSDSEQTVPCIENSPD